MTISKRFASVGLVAGGAIVLAIATCLLYMRIPSLKFLVLGAVGVAILVVVQIVQWYVSSERRVALIFTVAVMAAGLVYALFFPPIMVSDEESHFRSAYIFANVISPGYDGDSVRVDDLGLVFLQGAWSAAIYFTDTSWQAIFDTFSWFSSGEIESHPELIEGNLFGNAPDPNTIDNVFTKSPIQTKIGAVIPIVIARMLGLGTVPMFYAGRVGMVLYCCFFVYVAVRNAPFAKAAFGCVFLLPMSLHLIGSYSFDGPILGMTVALTALVLKAFKCEGQAHRRTLWGIVVLAFFLTPCKFVYMLAVIPAFLLPSKRFATRRMAIGFKVALLAACALGVVVFEFGKIVSLLTPSSSVDVLDRRGNERGTFYSVAQLAGDPVATVRLLFHTVTASFVQFMAYTMVGGRLGWLQSSIGLPQPSVIVFYALLVLAIFPTAEDCNQLGGSQRLACVFLFCAGGIALLVGMAINWTFTTEAAVQGMQGRYFLPFLPFLLLAIRPGFVTVKFDIPLAVAVFGVCLAVMNLQYIVLKVLS